MEKIKRFNQMLTGALERVNELKEEVEERRTKTGVYVNIGATSLAIFVCFFGLWQW